MKKFYVITFNKFVEEDFLVDFINCILKNLYQRGYFFYLDNVLSDENKYCFIFSGDINSSKVLVNEIKDFLNINNHFIVV